MPDKWWNHTVFNTAVFKMDLNEDGLEDLICLSAALIQLVLIPELHGWH